MMNSIQGIGQLSGLPPIGAASSTTGSAASTGVEGSQSFKNFLIDSIQDVNQMQVDANHAVEAMATGGDVNPAEVLSAVQKADIAFRMMMQVRNKLVQAYQEVQNIRI